MFWGVKIMKRISKSDYRIILLPLEIIILILIAFMTYNSLLMPTKKSTIYIPSDDTSTLLNTLHSHGYKIYTLDKLLVQFITLPKKGWYTIDGTEGRISFFSNLYTKHAKTMEVEVFAGETSVEISHRLANDMKLDFNKLLDSYTSQSKYTEGDIIAGRYTLARKADENTSMTYLMNTSNKLMNKFLKSHSKESQSFLETKALLIIASVIQKESNRVNEMPLISSVIYNRLKKGMRLQMDGTLNYGEYAHTIVTPERIKTDRSYYNTYKHKGLPPAPLSTVSLNALEAAISPKHSDYFFFMLTTDGSHIFANDYKTHLANVREFRKSMEENNVTKDTNTSIVKNLKTTPSIDKNITNNTLTIVKDLNHIQKSKPHKLHQIQK